MPYIIRKKNIIYDKNGVVIKITVEWNAKRIPWIFKGEKAFREDAFKKNRPHIPLSDLRAMRKDVLKIRFKSKESIKNRSIHGRSWNKEERRRLTLLKNSWCYVMPNGKLTIIRTDINTETGIKKDIELVYPDIDAAIRAQGHTENERMSETEHLHLDQIILVSLLNTFQSWVISTGNDFSEQKLILKKIQEELKHCRNPSKKIAHEQITQVAKMKDSLGRINPGALAARTTTANDNIGKRQQGITGIASFAASRKYLLWSEKKQIELNLASALFRIKTILNSADNFFQNTNAFHKRVNEILFLLQSAWVEPFFTPAGKIAGDLRLAKKYPPQKARQKLLATLKTLTEIFFQNL